MSFNEYLQLYEIDPITLTIAARVRYGTIWNAKHGKPIPPESAGKIKVALATLTGSPYTGSFVLTHTATDEQYGACNVSAYRWE